MLSIASCSTGCSDSATDRSGKDSQGFLSSGAQPAAVPTAEIQLLGARSPVHLCTAVTR